MKVVFFVVLWFIYGKSFSQITIINTSKNPIYAVKLYSSQQIFLDQSDKSGLIKWSSIENLMPSDTIYLKHPEYEAKCLLKNELKLVDSIVLNIKVRQLPEVFVSSVKNAKRFQTINACFRSYQLNDDSLIYYTDGLVDYLTETKKMNYLKMLREHRTYTDSSYINDIKKRPYMQIFKVARIPPPLREYIPSKFFNRNDLILSHQGDGTIFIQTSNNIKIGTIKKDSSFIFYFINDIFSNKLRKAPKYEANQLSTEINLVFKIADNDSNVYINNFNDLVYSKIYRKYDFKQNTVKEVTRIQNVEEIFVESIQYLNEVEKEKYNNRFGFPSDNQYKTAFWEKCNCIFYSTPPYSF